MITNHNEREFQIELINYIKEIVKTGKHVVTDVSGETSVKVGETTRFPDIVLWKDRSAEKVIATAELKNTEYAIDNEELLNNGSEKARELGTKYLVTWNVKQTAIWDITRTPLYQIKRYPPLLTIRTIKDIQIPQAKSEIICRAKELIQDLDDLVRLGKIGVREIDPLVFSASLSYAVEILTPQTLKSLKIKYSTDKIFQKAFKCWARKQGINRYDSEEFFRNAAKQIIYRILGKILFYFAFKRQAGELPDLILEEQDLKNAQSILQRAFDKIRRIDFQAIYESDLTDEIPWSIEAAETLQSLLEVLKYYNFAGMSVDVIGAVFEKLIPEDERHSTGQYFTNVDLVDFINGFTIRSKNDDIFDPTCGTGTFLVRAYNRYNWNFGVKDHHKLIEKIWGNDIAAFPAELAAINLFVRKLEDQNNYPRILSKDFFDIEPGQKVTFPHPRKGLDPEWKIDIQIPRFDGMMGNFPYIRQELIEKVEKGYKRKLEKTIAQEWVAEYPDAFKMTSQQKKDYDHWIAEGAKPENNGSLFAEVDFKLSGQADIYAYMFFHAARFLKPNGRMAFLTSNSWLDVTYGYELQKFFTAKFKIIAIIESRCEPWFEDVSVNTVVTVLERCDNLKERDEHIVRFVKMKRKLSELFPEDITIEHQRRHLNVDKIIGIIEDSDILGDEISKDLFSFENGDLRIRSLKQGNLREQLRKSNKTDKWGKYLRAPDVYFELMEAIGDKLVPLSDVAEVRRGYTTGINEFFYLTPEKAKLYRIEEEYLVPVVKSPKEIDGLVVDPSKLKYRLFLCNKSKDELRKSRHFGALRYIEEVGEKGATKAGIRWPKVPSVKGRKYWWGIGELKNPKFIINRFINERFFFPSINHNNYAIGDVVFVGYSINNFSYELLNSTIQFLFVEVNGRNNLGDGLLTFYGPDIKNLPVVDPKSIEIPKINIIRPVQSIFQEVKRKDRREFDSAILKALGLDPEKWLQRIYDGLTELVHERLELPKARKNRKKARKKQSIDKIIRDLVKEFQETVRPFPVDFLPLDYKRRTLEIPPRIVKGIIEQGMFVYLYEGSHKYQYDSLDLAKYAFYSQRPAIYIVWGPEDSLVLKKVIIEYEQWGNELRQRILRETQSMISDIRQVERIADEVMSQIGVRLHI